MSSLDNDGCPIFHRLFARPTGGNGGAFCTGHMQLFMFLTVWIEDGNVGFCCMMRLMREAGLETDTCGKVCRINDPSYQTVKNSK